MKRFIAILISCSLALTAGAMAQQDEAQPTPKKKQQEKAQGSKEAQSAAHPQTSGRDPHRTPCRRLKSPLPGLPTPGRMFRQKSQPTPPPMPMRRQDSTRKDRKRPGHP